ncbi:MAG: hypothetical protein J6Q61_01065 [Bacteroidales bacterium]|nr:hypothetical protein [Bacteroidales bacterium]
MKTYSTMQKSNESLQKWYRRLAKAADQRLVRLEGLAHESGYKDIKEWAYKKAMLNIKRWSGKGADRFNTKPPEDPEKLLAKIKDIQEFLESKTSSKSGIVSFYNKRTKTINKKYGLSFTWQDYANYYESGMNVLWDEIFGSKTALKTIGVIQQNEQQIIAAIKEAKEKHIKVSDLNESGDDNFLNLDADSSQILAEVYKALDEENLKIEDLF